MRQSAVPGPRCGWREYWTNELQASGGVSHLGRGDLRSSGRLSTLDKRARSQAVVALCLLGCGRAQRLR